MIEKESMEYKKEVGLDYSRNSETVVTLDFLSCLKTVSA